MTESEIQNVLYDFVSSKNHRLIIDNCKALNVRGEADLISVTKSDLIHEFEIKRTISDFKKEFESKKRKHKLLEGSGKYDYSANYFWFVIPKDLIEIDEVPNYAGIIQVSESGYKIIRSAPRRHNNKIDERTRRYLERGVTLRYWNLRD